MKLCSETHMNEADDLSSNAPKYANVSDDVQKNCKCETLRPWTLLCFASSHRTSRVAFTTKFEIFAKRNGERVKKDSSENLSRTSCCSELISHCSWTTKKRFQRGRTERCDARWCKVHDTCKLWRKTCNYSGFLRSLAQSMIFDSHGYTTPNRPYKRTAKISKPAKIVKASVFVSSCNLIVWSKLSS